MTHPPTRLVAAVAAVAAAALALAGPASAHHGWSDYDGDKPMTLKGRVKTASYENPHATITLDAEGKTYTVVLAPVSRMESRGATRESVAVGKDLTVVAYPSRTHAGELRAERILIPDGSTEKTVELR